MSSEEMANILIVDDECDICEIISLDLEDAGHKTFTANSGNEAFEVVKSNPEIDLIISDMRMPNGSGMDLLKMIREDNPDRPKLMFMTGYSDTSPEEAYDQGAQAFIAKPIDLNELIDHVSYALRPLKEKLKKEVDSSKIKTSFDIQFNAEDLCTNGRRVLNFGEGGFFLHVKEDLPYLEELVSFSLTDQTGKLSKIEGQGIIRWTRQKDSEELPKGIGVEFLKMDSNSIEVIENFLTENNVKRCFIPMK